MNELEDKEYEEYKERIKELIDKVENEKEKYKHFPDGYQRVIEAKEQLKKIPIETIAF